MMEDIMDNRPGGVNYVKDPGSAKPTLGGFPKTNPNWDRIEQLLNIIAQAAQHGPLLGPIVNAAQTELKQHVADAQKATDLAAKQKADDEAAGAIKHAQEVKAAEEKRLADEEAAIKARPPGKTPAELAADENATKAINEQALAGARVDPAAADREAQLQRDRDAAATAGNVGAATDTGSVRRI